MKLQNKMRIQFNFSPDLQLKLRIRRILRSKGYAALNSIRIEVRFSEVYLEGTVTTYFMKQMAQVLIMAVGDVHKVHNFLIVDPKGQQPEVKLINAQARSEENDSQCLPKPERAHRPGNINLPLRFLKAGNPCQ